MLMKQPSASFIEQTGCWGSNSCASVTQERGISPGGPQIGLMLPCSQPPPSLHHLPRAEVYSAHGGILALGTLAPSPPGQDQRGPEELTRPRHAGSSPCVLPYRHPQREEAGAPLTPAAGAASPPSPHLLRVLPDEQMRNAHCAAAGLRMPPPDHRMENDTGVARLQRNQESEGACTGRRKASLELKVLEPSRDAGLQIRPVHRCARFASGVE